MKTFIFLTLICYAGFSGKSQVVFCPQGAEWHYLFNWLGTTPGITNNETIKYVGDTVIGTETLKILSHKRFFLECSPIITKTFLKQKGDTILFKNSRTQNSWQILCNFAATQGQIWSTTVLRTDNTPVTYSYSVLSIQQVTANGFNLKQLQVIESNSATTYTTNLDITERYGCSGFLFNYSDYLSAWCDAEYFGERLCYRDSTFGLKQFTNKACDYSNTTGLNSLGFNSINLNLFPNPAQTDFTIQYNGEGNENLTLEIKDLLGRIVHLSSYKELREENISISILNCGVYLLTIKGTNTEILFQSKLIKQD